MVHDVPLVLRLGLSCLIRKNSRLAFVMTVVSPEPPFSAANVIDFDLSTGRRSMMPCEPVVD